MDIFNDKLIGINLDKIKQDFGKLNHEECGRIIFIQDDIVQIIGLTNVFLQEIIEFQNIGELNTDKKRAIVISINEYVVTAICFHIYDISITDTIAKRTGKFLEILVSDGMFGHTFNGFGQPLTNISVAYGSYVNINLRPPTMLDIGKNIEQLITGTQIIDTFTPIAYGQRQALIGDSGTGKTTILANIINSVKDRQGTISIYLSIGQNITNIKLIEKNIRQHHCLSYIMMNVEAGSTSIEKYLSPFVAMAIAEHFRKLKYDVLVFIDDMNSHAWAYQDIVNRTKQPIGKEGLPSDIFYQHALILSMGHVHKNGGTITVIPVVTTLDEDISDYLTTTIMSITDGQIVMSSDLAKAGKYPAININKSVSRIGRGIQNSFFKKLCTDIVIIMLKYNNLKELAVLNNDKFIDANSLYILNIGKKIDDIFHDGVIKSFLMQVTILYMILINKVEQINMLNLTACVQKHEKEMYKYPEMDQLIKSICLDYKGLGN